MFLRSYFFFMLFLVQVVIMDPSTFCYTFTTSSSCLWVAMCHFWHLLLAFTGSLPLPFSEYVDAQTRAIQWLTISSWSWSVHCATIHLVQIMEIASMLLFHWQPSEFQFLPSRFTYDQLSVMTDYLYPCNDEFRSSSSDITFVTQILQNHCSQL